MTRMSTAAIVAPLLLLGGCNVTDNGNGSSTISLDQNKIEQGADVLENGAAKAGAVAGNAIENAGPELRQSASDIKERAGRVADKVGNVDVDIDLNKADDEAVNKTAPKQR